MKSIIYLVKAKSLSALLISKSQHDFHYKCTKTNLYTQIVKQRVLKVCFWELT